MGQAPRGPPATSTQRGGPAAVRAAGSVKSEVTFNSDHFSMQHLQVSSLGEVQPGQLLQLQEATWYV